jgi:hypothetical protein
MIAWKAYLPQVLPHVPLCPQPIAVEAVRNSAIEFCEETWVWQADQEYTIAPGDPSNDLDDEDQGIVHKILHARATGDGGELEPKAPEWCDRYFPGWRQGEHTGRPLHYTQVRSSAFLVVPVPTVETTLYLTVALKPTLSSAQGVDELRNDYYEEIAAGAVARLTAMLKKPWSDPSAAKAYGNLYNDGKAIARSRHQRGYGRARIRTEAQFL